MKFSTSCLRNRYQILIGVCLALVVLLTWLFLFSGLPKGGKSVMLYIDGDDTIDSLDQKLRPEVCALPLNGLTTLVRHSHLKHHLRSGAYRLEPSTSAFTLFRRLRNGTQSPIRLTIPQVRTTRQLAGALSRKLMADSIEIAQTLLSNDSCARYGLDSLTIISLFLPNTYEVYWTLTPRQLLDRMQKESGRFWNNERRQLAEALSLSEVQVITLASIVDEETNNAQEKPTVAGLYYNRLQEGIPLQADPTVKFALGDFSLRRIYQRMLSVDSPYNTYRHAGLPPGPIRIPTIEGINAVLHLERHNYIYMCASPLLNGTHVFAANYRDHQANARAYAQALNDRGIH